ncbi:porin [Poseidonibacter antarcticus]|uniref:porin n=1 Tax=Poseidonibacter antarcticus TaxID=2478538 RepID=UPI000EF5026D|nr:porin [Poseidonibacter antarcticus]
MKKIAKLSLVAAAAVVGLSTTANAQALENAIKDVDVSGSVVYRYNDYNNDEAGTSDANSNNYKIGLNLSSKVNEDLKFNSRFIVGGADSGFASLDAGSASDGNVDVTLSNVYFGYTGISNTTVNVGKQGLTTPWTVAIDSDGNEQTGTGVLALSTVGPVTLAAAYFNQSNLDTSSDAKLGTTKVSTVIDGSDDIVTVGAIVAAGPVTMDAWYIDVQDIADSYTIGAKANFDLSGASVGIDARYASLDLDDSNIDNDIFKVKLTGKMGIFNAKVLYAMTNDEGGLTALDNDAVTTVNGWSTTVNGKADADYWQTTLGVNALSNLNISANYNNVDYVQGSDDMEEEELYAQFTYKMSKNFTTYVRYGTYTKENNTTNTDINDDVRGRLQVQYTF